MKAKMFVGLLENVFHFCHYAVTHYFTNLCMQSTEQQIKAAELSSRLDSECKYRHFSKNSSQQRILDLTSFCAFKLVTIKDLVGKLVKL